MAKLSVHWTEQSGFERVVFLGKKTFPLVYLITLTLTSLNL